MSTREWLSHLFWSAAFWTGVLAGATLVVVYLLFLIEAAR